MSLTVFMALELILKLTFEKRNSREKQYWRLVAAVALVMNISPVRLLLPVELEINEVFLAKAFLSQQELYTLQHHLTACL